MNRKYVDFVVEEKEEEQNKEQKQLTNTFDCFLVVHQIKEKKGTHSYAVSFRLVPS